MPIKDTTVAEYPGLDERTPDSTSAQLVTVVSIRGDGLPLLDLGNGTIVAARMAIRATRDRIDEAIARQHQAVVLFEDGDRARPIVVGFIEPVEPASHVALSEGRETMPTVEADVDGRRLRVTALDEIVLQCGRASITLRRNGRVIVRGTYVETHSEGTNRIKGGQVQIN